MEPTLAVILKSVEIPPIGGDTVFSNMELAWENLDKGDYVFSDSNQGATKSMFIAQGSFTAQALPKDDDVDFNFALLSFLSATFL